MVQFRATHRYAKVTSGKIAILLKKILNKAATSDCFFSLTPIIIIFSILVNNNIGHMSHHFGCCGNHFGGNLCVTKLREEVEAATDTPEASDDSRERSRGLMSQGIFLALFFFFPLSSPLGREEVEAVTDTPEATDDSRERSRGGVGDLDRSVVTSGSSSEGGSAGLDDDGSLSGVFLPFPRPRPRPDVVCFLGAMIEIDVDSPSSTAIMQQCGKAADYIGTLGMCSSSATHTLAIRRVRWPYAGHTLAIRRVRWPYAGHTLVICWSYADIRWSYATHMLLISSTW